MEDTADEKGSYSVHGAGRQRRKSRVGNLGKDARSKSEAMEVSNEEFQEVFLEDQPLGAKSEKKARKNVVSDDSKQRKRSTEEVSKNIESEMALKMTAKEIDDLVSEAGKTLYRNSIQLHIEDDAGDAGKDDEADLLQSVQWNFNQVSDWIEDLKSRGERLTYHNVTCIYLLTHYSE